MSVDTSMYAAAAGAPKSFQDYQAENQQNQLNQLNIQSGRQKLDAYTTDQNMLNQFRGVFASGVDPMSTEGQSRLNSIDPVRAAAYFKTQQEQATSQAAANIDNAHARDFGATADQKAYDLTRQKLDRSMQMVSQSSTPELARQHVSQLVTDGVMSMQDAQRKLQEIPDDPAQFQQWRLGSIAQLMSAHDQFEANKPTMGTRNTGNTIQNTATNPMTGAVTVNATTPLQATPGEVLSARTAQRGQDMTQQTQYTVAGLDANGKDAGGGTGGLSPAAIENAATRYNVDGTLPPQLGRGTQGARDMRAIQNRAAELSMGTDPTQLRVNQLDAKGATSALAQLTKSQTMAASFENTANQNADLALSLSKKNDRTGIPMINAGLQAWRTGTGSPEATQFAAANETFVNEYAKIMSGGLGNAATSDSASRHAHELLSVGMTDGQYEGNVHLLQQEMRNRMKGYDDQTTAVKARIGGKGAAPAATPAGATPTVSNW